MNSQTEFEREILNPDIIVKYSIRAYFSKIVPSFALCAYSLFVLTEIVNKNIRFGHLFQINILTPIILMSIYWLLSSLYKITFGKLNVIAVVVSFMGLIAGYIWFQQRKTIIPHSYVDNYLIIISAVSFLYCLYYIIYAKTGTITLSKRRLVDSFGVFTRTKDGTDLNDIKDNDLKRGTLDLIFGLAKIEFKIKSNKDSKVIRNITAHDAERINNYLSANTFHSAVEYWTAKDRINGVGKSKRQPIQTMDDQSVDDDSNEIED